MIKERKETKGRKGGKAENNKNEEEKIIMKMAKNNEKKRTREINQMSIPIGKSSFWNNDRQEKWNLSLDVSKFHFPKWLWNN